MTSKAVNRSAAQWAQIMTQYHGGAESEQELCERLGVKLGTFRKWCYRHAKDSGQSTPSAKQSGFVQIRAPQLLTSSSAMLTIHAPGAVRIDCPASLGIEDIARLARAVHNER